MSTKVLTGLGATPAPMPQLPLIAWLVAVSTKLRARLAHRRAILELSALDDRMLRDIGISRSEIQSVLTDRSGERVHTVETPC